MDIEKKRSWIFGIIGVAAGVAAGWGIAAAFGPFAADTGGAGPGAAPTPAASAPAVSPAPNAEQRVLAKVGDRVITEADLRAYLYGRHGEESLRTLIDREVVALEAGRRKLTVSQQEIDEELRRMQQGYDSEEEFYRSMREQLGLTKEHLVQDITHRLLSEKIAIASIVVKDSEVEEYIRERPEEFESYERYHLQKIVVRTAEQANAVIAQLRSGADFGETAQTLSMDDDTARFGGDIGWIDEHDPFVDPALLKTAATLKPGQFSEPFEAEGGYVVLRMVDKKVENDRTPEQIRSAVRKELALRRAKPLNEVVEELRNKYGVEIGDVGDYFKVDKK
ncbi:peptidylprolyl isomerase [Paenibacillus thermoaerophilus]|jgi:foldase protein PrsA|uniref:peptidylprolyl isomerase n=1 Tax=Paenibacillus thermoaerophilus TaxID=1215385 RepID=A0ABW2V270_9BACL|nr:peptidylprolyl isomerase [Paenibacillus thermoaerophilus]TMV09440.1 peptidylprolyl isomerase [Paenibacillus thermoaerophilus]